MKQFPDLEALVLFTKVVEATSFSKVSRQHAIPKATLSRKIAQLEATLGSQLIIRNTRHLQLTDLGREIYQKATDIVNLVEQTQSLITQTKETPRGLLRITAGVEYGLSVLSPLVNLFLKQYPEVQVELDLTGRRVDLIYEGFDLGVRIGPLEDSALASRKIGSFTYGLFASPKYLNETDPVQVDKLSNHTTLAFTRTGARKEWVLFNRLDEKKISISPRLLSNNYWSLLNAAESGLGIVFMPEFLAAKSISKGRIQHILKGWRSEAIPIHFLYPSQRYLNPKVRAFIDFVVDELKRLKP